LSLVKLDGIVYSINTIQKERIRKMKKNYKKDMEYKTIIEEESNANL